MCLHLFGQPFDPRPDRGEPIFGIAGRTHRRHRFAFAALVAHQPFQEPMFHHPGVTLVTANLMPAGPAQGHRRIAAPVQEQQRLFAPFNTQSHRAAQGGRHPRIARQFLDPHINRPHHRHHRQPEPGGQIEPLVFARLRIGPGFQRWRRRGQHHLRPIQRRPQHRHVAGIIQHPVLLLVGRVMFFIDHDQPKVAERQEQRRPRPHHQLRIALPDHAPAAAAFGHRDT